MSTARCFTPLVPMDEGYAYEDELQMVNELEEREGEAHALAFIQGNFGPDGYTCTLLGDLDDKFKPDDLRARGSDVDVDVDAVWRAKFEAGEGCAGKGALRTSWSARTCDREWDIDSDPPLPLCGTPAAIVAMPECYAASWWQY
eukprot:tig00021535_g22217.t1